MMKSGTWRRRQSLVLLVLGLALLACLGDMIVAKFSAPVDDFAMYWSAVRLLLQGEAPYSPKELTDFQADIGRDFDYPPLMYNPPWTFTLLLPFGLLPYAWARLLWMVVSLAMILVSGALGWRIYAGTQRGLWIAWVLAATFFPTYPLLISGQIGAWVLLGLVGFLHTVREERWWSAGACMVLVAQKPQPFVLLWVTLAMWILCRRRWQVLGGALAGVVVMSAVPLLLRVSLPQGYIDVLLNHPPREWMPPTLGTLLRSVVGTERFGLQFVPLGFGLLWAALHWWHCREHWVWSEQLPLLLLVGFVTSVYSWTHDHVALLLVVIQIATSLLSKYRSRSYLVVLGSYALLTAAAWWLYGTTELNFVWLSPALLVIYLMAQSAQGLHMEVRP